MGLSTPADKTKIASTKSKDKSCHKKFFSFVVSVLRIPPVPDLVCLRISPPIFRTYPESF